jgi:hypothetical protein
MNNSNACFNDTCSNCVLHEREVAELEKALDEARDEYSYQYRQHEDEISSMVENLPVYRLWLDARARLDVLSAKYRLRNQSAKTMLEEVGHPESNTTLRAPSSINGEENEH